MSSIISKKMKNKKFTRCIVTGGAGFIGSHLTERLLKSGYLVTVIDDLSEGKWENLPSNRNLTKVKASILGNITGIVAGHDAIFHLAAIPRLQRSLVNPWKTHQVNVDGTLKLLLAAKKYHIKKFIFASSSSVYGNQKKLPFRETMRPSPLVPYSLHKLIGEEYCQMFSDLWGLETLSLRYFNVYGPRMNPESNYANLIPKFIKLIAAGKRPIINGSGLQKRDFTYVSDVVEATMLALESTHSGEIFNIGYGKNFSVNEVTAMINQVLKKNIKPIYGPAVIEPKMTLASTQKARKLLGWKPKINLENGLKLMTT